MHESNKKFRCPQSGFTIQEYNCTIASFLWFIFVQILMNVLKEGAQMLLGQSARILLVPLSATADLVSGFPEVATLVKVCIIKYTHY